MLVVIIVGGTVLLLALAVLIGTSMDTAAQRHQWHQVAEQRRLLAQERRTAPGRCDDCPHRAQREDDQED